MCICKEDYNPGTQTDYDSETLEFCEDNDPDCNCLEEE